MLKTILLIVVVAITFAVLGANVYTSALDSQITYLEERQQITEDSIAFYNYEYKHSTSGTRRHVGKALQKVVDRLSINEQVYAIRQKELQELKDMRQQFSDNFW